MLASLPTVGSEAPDFSLPSTAGGETRLSTLRGRTVLLAFFPLAFTGVCTAEMCAFSEDCGRFETAGTTVVPISVDSVASLKEFKAKERIRLDLLSDFKRVVSRAFGVLDEQKFQSRRSYFLIDKGGLVRWTWVEEHNGLRRNNDELLAKIEALA